jgi:hypothetical protein
MNNAKIVVSTDDIHKLFETKDRNVLLYIHEGSIPTPAVEYVRSLHALADPDFWCNGERHHLSSSIFKLPWYWSFNSNAKRFTSTTNPYSLNVNKVLSGKEHLKIEKIPTVIVLRNGKELKRVDQMNPEAMKGVEEVLKAWAEEQIIRLVNERE